MATDDGLSKGTLKIGPKISSRGPIEPTLVSQFVSEPQPEVTSWFCQSSQKYLCAVVCDTDECVGMVRGVTAGLFREKRELVELLNAMNQRVQAEEHPANKVLRKVASSGGERSVELLNKIAEWMEEKERVKRLSQMVSSLHGALEADAESGAMAPAANKQDSFAPPPSRPPALSKIFRVKQTTDALDVEVVAAASNVASLASTATSNDASFASTPTATSNDASFASGDVDVITDSAPPRHPRAFSKPSRKNPPPIQTELFIYTSDGGSSARSSASGWFGSFRSFRSVSSGTGAWFGRRLSV